MFSASSSSSEKGGAVGWVKGHWAHFVETMKGYWVGTKLLWADVHTSAAISRRLLLGASLTRRERKQLLRTTADMLRMIPFAVFLIVPFLELLLPLALYMFPNMLPSTFQDSTKKEQQAKATLGARIAMAGFLSDALGELEKSSTVTKADQAGTELNEFLLKARDGVIDNEDVLRFAKYFGDDLTLDALPRPQLVHLCNYMGLRTFGGDNLLRFQLRHTIRELREDDQRILFEGTSSLSRQEIQEACAERGMRGVGLSKTAYAQQLEGWLELSANRQVPIALLIMSRAFSLQTPHLLETRAEETAAAALAKSMTSLGESIVNEAVVEAAVSQHSREMKERRLMLIKEQNELIAHERRNQENAAKRAETDVERNAELESMRQMDVVEQVWGVPPKPVTETEKNHTAPSTTTVVEDEAAAELASKEEYAFEQERKRLEKLKRELATESNVEEDEQDALEFDDRLHVAELLADMAQISALEREREDLTDLKAKMAEYDGKKPTLDGGAAKALEELDDHHLVKEVKKDDEPKPDAKFEALKSKLHSMLGGLEKEIERVDLSIGEKLHLIDTDNDGVVSVEELRGAVLNIWRAQGKDENDAGFEQFLHNVLQEVDRNKDGVVTVDEVKAYLTNLERKKENM